MPQPTRLPQAIPACCRRVGRVCARVGLVLTVMVVLLGGSGAHADRVRVLRDECEALQARIDLIQQANEQISVTYFIVDTGEVPSALLELMRQARQRGVRVRLLVDGLVSRLPVQFERFLAANHIEVRGYHNTGQGKPKRLYRRLHSKLLIVDSEHVILGSRNLRDKHFGLAGEDNFIDCDAYFNGDIALTSQQYFDWLWNSAHVQPPPHREPVGVNLFKFRFGQKSSWSEAWDNAETPHEIQGLLHQSLQRVQCRFDVALDTGTDWALLAEHDVYVEALHDCRCNKSAGRMRRKVIEMIDDAKVSIIIETPYPALTKELRGAIIRARRRGVCVTLLTNSLTSNEHLSVYAAYQNDKRLLLKEGVHLHEYCGVGRMHAKSMLVDDCLSMIGSYNFDSLSEKYNLEFCAIIRDLDVAADLRASIDSRLCQSRRMKSGTLLLDTEGGDDVKRRMRMMMRRVVVECYRHWL